jgi:hypothetical protein
LHRDYAHSSRDKSVSGGRCHFICSTIELFQSFALHLQLSFELPPNAALFALGEEPGFT